MTVQDDAAAVFTAAVKNTTSSPITSAENPNTGSGTVAAGATQQLTVQYATWWGVSLTSFTGCIQVSAPGGGSGGYSQLMTVTSDAPPTSTPAPTPSSPMALIENNAGSGTVEWAYKTSQGSSSAGTLGLGASQAVPYSSKTLWFGVYLTGFTGTVEVVGPSGTRSVGYNAQINIES